MLKETMLQVLTDLVTAYPKEMQVTDNTAVLWARFLGGIADEEFMQAADQWIRTERHAPTIADMLTATSVAQGTDGEQAWQNVLDAVRSGLYRRPDFTCDMLVSKAVGAAGGWSVIGQTLETDLHYRKREFLDTYKRVAARPTALNRPVAIEAGKAVREVAAPMGLAGLAAEAKRHMAEVEASGEGRVKR